jgi:branched-chain amino acid transport system substrate-binding protein
LPQRAAYPWRRADHRTWFRFRGVRAGRRSDSDRHEPRAHRRRRGAEQGDQHRARIWRDDINAKGGLLGRPIEIIVYDDQSNPANVPNLYTKLITVDKADLLLGPYGTNFVAPAMPTIIQNKKMLISYTAIGINDQYHYDKYFSMVPVGSDGVNAFSKGFFEMAARQNPKPQTVAISAADAEFAQAAATPREIKKPASGSSTTELSAEHDRFRAGGARSAATDRISSVGAYPPDIQDHPRRQRSNIAEWAAR